MVPNLMPQGRVLRVRWRLTPRQLTVIDTFASSALAPPAIVDASRAPPPPRWRTRMVSASTIVDSRWAITTNVVRSRIAASACCIACSVPESMLAVASSRINICGASTSTRASANSCFCPTDNVFPCSPRCVCSPSLSPRAGLPVVPFPAPATPAPRRHRAPASH